MITVPGVSLNHTLGVATNYFTDPEGQNITLSLTMSDDSNLQSFISFSDITNRVVIAPTFNEIKTWMITLKGTDPEGFNDSITFRIIVKGRPF